MTYLYNILAFTFFSLIGRKGWYSCTYKSTMKKLIAILGALIGGGLGIALIGSGTQVAHAMLTEN